MPRLLDTRLGRVEGRRSASAAQSGAEAARQRQLWRAKAAIGTLIREALVKSGVDPSGVARLALADEAAAALAAIPDTPELQGADLDATAAPRAPEQAHAELFTAKITRMTAAFADAAPPDFANASFAELLAWALAVTARGDASAQPL